MRMRSTVRPSSCVLPSWCAVPASIASRSLFAGSSSRPYRSFQRMSVFGGTNLSASKDSRSPPNSAAVPRQQASARKPGSDPSPKSFVRRRYLCGGVPSIQSSCGPRLTVQAGSVEIVVVSHFWCRIIPAGAVSAACACSRKPGELFHGVVTTSATAAAPAKVAAMRRRRFPPTRARERGRAALTRTCRCRRSAAARSSRFRSLTGSLIKSLPFEAGPQRGQPPTHPLADDTFRAVELCSDLGVATALEVMSLDRPALLWSQGLEQLDTWSTRGRLEDLDRFVVDLDRLHSERPPCLVLNLIAA